MTTEGRERFISECLDMENELMSEGLDAIQEILEHGFKGYRNMTDIELVEEHESLSEVYEETFGFPYDS